MFVVVDFTAKPESEVLICSKWLWVMLTYRNR